MIEASEREVLESLDEKELASLTQALVRIDSVIRPESGGTERNVVNFIAGWIRREIGIDPLVEEVEEGRANIIATLDSGKPGLCLMLEGHTDVVSEGSREAWSHDPFGGEISGGRIYGRGSCDMKAGIAVALICARVLARSKRWAGKMRLGFVCDEEGMMIGIKHFIRSGHADDVAACLVPEPEENNLCITMKGAIRAIVRVHGRMAHGAMPLSGVNPNTRLARIILAFESFEAEEKKRCGVDPLIGLPSITFTVLRSPPPGSPAQLNVMPAEAVAYVDIRTTLAQSHDELRERLRGILRELGTVDRDFRADIEFIEDRPVVGIRRDEPIARISAEAFQDVTGREPVWNGVPGATDGTFLRAWRKIPCLVNGPGPRHIPHQVDEYVELDQLWECARVYALSSLRFLRAGSSKGE
ncbi:MAG TPA: M20 family metallopeptidase [Spirochaetia bacterium]|nr:M20 family metallopeptidase [Spirochaetia bacterium]